MVTKQDIKKVRNFINNRKSGINVSIPSDILCAIDSMCADYEFKYDM